MVLVKLIGKFYCKQDKCEDKSKTGFCKAKDLSCIYLDYQSEVKVLN